MNTKQKVVLVISVIIAILVGLIAGVFLKMLIEAQYDKSIKTKVRKAVPVVQKIEPQQPVFINKLDIEEGVCLPLALAFFDHYKSYAALKKSRWAAIVGMEIIVDEEPDYHAITFFEWNDKIWFYESGIGSYELTSDIHAKRNFVQLVSLWAMGRNVIVNKIALLEQAED